MPEEDASRALETLGLTGKEARAYLGLLRSGVSTAQQVSVHLGVQYPAVYRILQSLQSKGWVEVSPEILRLLFDALGRSRRAVRVVLSEGNRGDLAELGGLLSRMMQVQFHFPTRPLPKTRLAHTYVVPSDEEVFILNSFYRDGDLVTDKLQGLWIGDMDFVRIQLETMLLVLGEPRTRKAIRQAQ